MQFVFFKHYYSISINVTHFYMSATCPVTITYFVMLQKQTDHLQYLTTIIGTIHTNP